MTDLSNCSFLFLTGLFPKETEKSIISNSIGLPQYAANNLQWNLVYGFDDNNVSLTIFNLIYIGSYPRRYKKIFVKNYSFSHNGKSCDRNIGFCNLPIIKRFSRFHNAKKIIRRWIAKNKDKKKVIFAYAMTDSFDKSLVYAKKIDSNIKTCLIVPDLPQYMNTSAKKSIIYSILKSIDVKKQFNLSKKIDSFVLLTKEMSAFFPNKPFLVIEGIATKGRKLEPIVDNWKGKTKILYAGGLKCKYGIMHLVNAFKLLDSNCYMLIICGDGECKDEIICESKCNKSIVFMGSLSHENVLQLEKISDVLVNPRMEQNEVFTKYSFPSKILEYLSNKKPVVSYKLLGIPDEYDSVLFYPKDYSEFELSLTIKEAASMSDDEKKRYEEKVAKFVESKSPKYQVRKIIDFVLSE